MSRVVAGLCVLCCLIFAAAERAAAQERIGPRADYAGVAAALERFIDHEMRDKGLPAVSVALVDDQEIVWARGLGYARPADSVPATAETVYRVGSVSKLFTAIGVMQLVERGVLDLDARVGRWLEDFRPANPFDTPISLRHLMAHRSGLVREPPTGNYFDDTGADLGATVASLNTTALVYEPGTRTKYSNAGIAVVGRVLEAVTAEPFARQLDAAVLEPLGMRSSAFEPRPELKARLAAAGMWTYDGRAFDAPAFELGMAPAGSMYSTVTDLGRSLSMLFADGRAASGEQVLSRESLEEMWRPQVAAPGATAGYGLGFGISTLDGHRRIGHGGAIYGFATALAALPDQKLGVVAVTTVDAANAVTDRIADAALRLMLAARQGLPLPVPDTTLPVSAELLTTLPGRYTHGTWTVEVQERDGHLFLWPGPAGLRVALRSLRDTLVIDDRLLYGPRVLVDGDRLIVGPDTFTRAPLRRPEPAPERWRGLIGEYGPDHDVLYILEKDGRLHALIEWFFLYPLEEVQADTFAFPDWGLYAGERLVFTRDGDGRATAVEAAGVRFERRAVGPEEGATFRITPVQPVDSLRPRALAARPPAETGRFREPELVDLATLDPTIRFDIRYATTNNFMGAVFYREPRALLQRPAAEALLRAHRRLAHYGYGLLIHDAYRPWYVTRMFWDATPEELRDFVADPSTGSRHNRGCAVDLTLYDLATGEPVEMLSGYDEFSPRAYPDYPGGTSLQRWQRELLRRAMEAEGFRVYDAEWWHFDYKDWREYPILNVPLGGLRP